MIIYIKLILTAIFWGGTFIAGRVVARDVGPFSAAFFRFFIASIFLLLFTYRIEGRLPLPHKKQMIPLFLLGMTGVFSYNIFFFKGLKLITAGRAAIIIAGNPIVITLLSVYFFKEKLNLIKVIGIIVSVTGAIIVISKGSLNEIVNSGIGWGEIFIFDMGKSVKIVDLAKKMIKLSGLEVGIDIEIKFTGLRPGEKLYEELLNDKENTMPTHHPQIMIAKVKQYKYETVSEQISNLITTNNSHDNYLIVSKMKKIIPEFISRNSIFEKLDNIDD